MKTDYVLKGQQRSLAEPRACLATQRDRTITGVKKATRAAGLSDNLHADPKEALVRSLKRALAKLEQLIPDAPFDAGTLSVLTRALISMSLRISTPIHQEGHLFFPSNTRRGCSYDT